MRLLDCTKWCGSFHAAITVKRIQAIVLWTCYEGRVTYSFLLDLIPFALR